MLDRIKCFPNLDDGATKIIMKAIDISNEYGSDKLNTLHLGLAMISDDWIGSKFYSDTGIDTRQLKSRLIDCIKNNIKYDEDLSFEITGIDDGNGNYIEFNGVSNEMKKLIFVLFNIAALKGMALDKWDLYVIAINLEGTGFYRVLSEYK